VQLAGRFYRQQFVSVGVQQAVHPIALIGLVARQQACSQQVDDGVASGVLI
jgi:hypothetical protein